MKTLLLQEALILFIATNVAANINVNVIISRENSVRKSQAIGSDSDVIDYAEIGTFQLYDGKIIDATKIFFGKKPDDVYLKRRTPWGDLYDMYKWPEVRRTLKATRAEMFSIDFETIEIMTQYLNNTKNKVELRKEVENTVESDWIINGELAGINIQYDIDMKSAFGETTLHYNSTFGHKVKKSKNVTIGPLNDIEITLKPGQRAKAVLTATKGRFKVRVNYEATLSGSVAINYKNPFKGHHFFNFDVNRVMSAGGLNKILPFSEVLTVSCYSDYEVMIQDVDTNEILNV